MGFFSNIVRESRKPPPAAQRTPHGADPPSGRAAKAVLPAESRPLGLKTAAIQLATKPHEAFRPAVVEQDIRRKDFALVETPTLAANDRQAVDSSPVEPTRGKGPAEPNNGKIAPLKPAARRQTDRPGRRPAQARTGTDRPSASSKIISAGPERADHEDEVLRAPTATHLEPSARETSTRSPEGGPVVKSAAPPSFSPPTQPPPSASPPPTPSAPAGVDDRSVKTLPAAATNQGDGSLPPSVKPHPSETLENPPPRAAAEIPGAPDLLPPAAAIPAKAPPGMRPGFRDDPGPSSEIRVVAALPAAPIRIAAPLAPAPVQNQEEGRLESPPRRPTPTPGLAREGPKVRIGLLEVVVVQAPASAPQATRPAHRDRTDMTSRHYLRNI